MRGPFTVYSEKPLLHKRQAEYKAGALRTVAIDVTPKCNMTCDHCYAETFRKPAAVDLDILLGALDEFYGLGVFHYVLQGGEPIVDPERLETILRGCRPDEIYINVVSNGWQMTRQRIRWLKDLKVDKISFSLDSGIRGEHDQNRLKGSYDRVLKAVDDVLDEGLLTSISIVVTNKSLYSKGFDAALQFIKDKKIRMDVQIAEPVGKWDGKKDILITPGDAAYIKRLQHELGVLANGQTVISRDIYCGQNDHCPAGTGFLSLSADGNLLPCNFLQFSMGKVGDRSIAGMRRDLLANDWFDDSHPVCLCGEDHDFIDRFIMPYVNRPKPLSARHVFGLDSGKPGDNP